MSNPNSSVELCTTGYEHLKTGSRSVGADMKVNRSPRAAAESGRPSSRSTCTELGVHMPHVVRAERLPGAGAYRDSGSATVAQAACRERRVQRTPCSYHSPERCRCATPAGRRPLNVSLARVGELLSIFWVHFSIVALPDRVNFSREYAPALMPWQS